MELPEGNDLPRVFAIIAAYVDVFYVIQQFVFLFCTLSIHTKENKVKKSTMVFALAVASLGMMAAQAGEFDGGYIGGKIGVNRTDMTDVSRQSPAAAGLEAGYNWDMNGMLLGVDGFWDFNEKKTHTGTALAPASVNYGSQVYGLDLKLGLPNGNWMPYAKLGYAHTDGRGDAYASVIGNGGAHYGVGVEYKFAPNWSVAGEWTNNTGKNGAVKLNNNNFTIGLNYYFGKPYVAPLPMAAAPVAVKKEEPKPAPAPVPKESWKTVVTEKLITIEGTNFDTNSAKLKAGAGKKLDEAVDFAAKYKDANLAITGYTDSQGSDKLNQKLSAKRAESVKAYLIKKGVAADRMTTKGEGAANPVGDNKTKAGRAQNRRVEIRSMVKEEKKVRVTE
jgi:OOP family OmpA-OmpF porin